MGIGEVSDTADSIHIRVEPILPRAKLMFDFLTKNFVVLSAVIVASAAAYSMLFLTSYLGVFDWNLVWLIEYSDLAKFGLMAVALISPILVILTNQFDALYKTLVLKDKSYRWAGWVFATLIVLVAASGIYIDLKDKNGQATYHLMYAIAALSALGFMWVICRDFDALKNNPRFSTLYNHAVLLAIALGFVGVAHGFYVKDVSKQVSEITTKKETFKDAKIVLMLSHHIVFISGGRVVTIPAADLVELVSDVQGINLLP